MKRGLSIICGVYLFSMSLNADTIELRKGWNLISTPYKPVSEIKIDSLDRDKIKTILTYEWKSGLFGKVFGLNSNPKFLRSSQGYWIEAKEDYNLTTPAFDETVEPEIYAGWNLIGFPVRADLTSFKQSMLKKGEKIETIITYEWKKGLFGDVFGLNANPQTLKLHNAYWVKVLKQASATKIDGTDKKLIAYSDKEYDPNNLKTVSVSVAGKTVDVKVPADATKAELRIVDKYENEIVGGIVLNSDDIANGSYTVPTDKVSSLDAITSVAYYVMSANPSGVPQPLSDVVVKNSSGDEIGTTDANGIMSINVGDVKDDEVLTFEKDGYSVNSVKFTKNKAVVYVTLSPSTTVDADEFESEQTSNSRVLNRNLNKYYPIKTLQNKTIGLIRMDSFSANPNLSKVSFDFSNISPISFYGKEKLSTMVGEYETNGTKYVPQIITGVQGIVKIGGKVAKGDDVKFSNIDKNGNANLIYYIPNFFADEDYIKTQIDKNGAEYKFYAFDGKNWVQIDDSNVKIADYSKLDNSNIKRIFKKLGYGDNDLVAKVEGLDGVKSVVGVLWNKMDTLKVFKNIQVKVTEEDGTPIKNALVKVLNKTATTDKNGYATFDIKVPKDLSNITFEASEPEHYRNLDRVRLDNMSDNKEITITLKRPPSTGTVNVATVDENLNSVPKALIDIITPAVLAEVGYKNGIISVGQENSAEFGWYIKPNKSSASNNRIFRTLSRKAAKLATDKWTKIVSGNGKNSINVGELLNALIKAGDPAVGSLKLGVYVKHKNGIEDGKETSPVEIGQADIMFNKKLLAKFGLEMPSDKDAVYMINEGDSNIDDVGIAGKATASTPYIAVKLPSNAKDLNITWNVMLVYEKDSDNQFYWDGKKWVKSQKLVDAGLINSYAQDMYNIAKDLNFTIKGNEDYLSFNQLANFLSKEDIIKALFIKKDDVDNNNTQSIVDFNKNEDSVLKGTIRLVVLPDVSFKMFDKETKFVTVAEAQQEDIKVGEVLSLSDVALQPASIIPHHIYAKTSIDGLMRIANIPLEFGNDGDKSYLDILASKVGYRNSQRKTIPGFTQDDPNTPELEDVANITLKLDQIEKGSLKIIVKDENNNTIEGAKVVVPSSHVKDGKLENLLIVDNKSNDKNSAKGVVEADSILEGAYNISVLKERYIPASVGVIIKQNKPYEATVTLKSLDSGITLKKPYVNDLDFTQSNEYLSVNGKITDTTDGNYSKACKVNLVLNSKVIDITPKNDGSFQKAIKLDRGVNKVTLFVTNAEGTFKTSEKQFIYIGKTAYFHGYVLDNDGNKLSNAILEIEPSSGETIYKVTDSDGRYVVNDMPIGKGTISAVWIDENGYMYNAKDDYKIEDTDKDVEENLTIKTQKLTVTESAEIYIDRYNNSSDMPVEVTTDKLSLSGRVVSFDKEHGEIKFDVFYDDGTENLIVVDNEKLISTNQQTNTYTYKIDIPLKDGMNYISVSAQNPVYGGEEFGITVNKKKSDQNATAEISPNIYVTSLSGIPVYATISISNLDGSPAGIYNADDYNKTYAIVKPSLKPNKYYIFDVTADGYKENKTVKYINQDTEYLYFAMKPLTETNQTELQNEQPVVNLNSYNYGNAYEFSADAFDPDGDELTYKWTLDGKDVNISESYFDVELKAGEHTIAVYVNDGHHSDINDSTTVKVEANNLPSVTVKDTTLNVKEGETNSTTYTVSDNDGDDVDVYAVSSDESVATVTVENGKIIVEGAKEGEITITIVASDGTDEVAKTINVKVYSSSSEGLQKPPSPGVNDSDITPPPA